MKDIEGIKHTFRNDQSSIWVCDISELMYTEVYQKYYKIAKKEFGGFHKKRIHEKAAVWYILESVTDIALESLTYTHTQGGKPVLDNGKFISISHSKDIVAIAIADHSIGVDVEHIVSISSGTANKFMSEKENDILQEYNLNTVYLWTAKEAFFKHLENQDKVYLKDIVVKKISPSDDFWVFQMQSTHRSQTVMSKNMGSYILSFTKIIDK